MEKNRYVNTKFWNDPFVISLDRDAGHLFIYLLTNGHTNIAGIYEIAPETIAREAKFKLKELPELFKALEPKIRYINNWIIIKNFQKHQKLNDSVKKGIKTIMSQLPPEIARFYADWRQAKTASDSLYTGSDLSESESKSESKSESELIQRDEPSAPSEVKELIDFFYRATKAIQGIEPIIDGGKDGAMLKLRLKKFSRGEIEQFMIWHLTRKKKVENNRGEWDKQFKHSPSIATMLSTPFLNQLLSDKENNRDFGRETGEWVDRLYKRPPPDPLRNQIGQLKKFSAA